jgi:hypothetical protein
MSTGWTRKQSKYTRLKGNYVGILAGKLFHSIFKAFGLQKCKSTVVHYAMKTHGAVDV